jgi:hypothetical protein
MAVWARNSACKFAQSVANANIPERKTCTLLTQSEYENLVNSGDVDAEMLYMITEE